MRRIGALAGLCLALATTAALAGGEIYGTIETTDGKRLTGPIRWDVNENFWDDSLDGAKKPVKREEEGFKISIFGWKIGGDDGYSSSALSVPFGHIRSLERTARNRAMLVLKNGAAMEIRASASDMGSGNRGIEIEGADGATTELSWNSIRTIEFRQGPGEGRDAERLFATVTTREGSHDGFLVWDRDESLTGDVLDGYDPEGEEHEIAFADIRKIERQGSVASKVTLRDDTTLTLDGTNDVESGHRGIVLAVDGLGTVEIDWRDVDTVTFKDPPASPRYADFDGGARLSGTVRAVGGRVHTGEIVWDRDENWSFETLDGHADDVAYAIRFARIASITRVDRHSSEIALRNGRKLVLSGTNDVDDDNRGILVTAADGSVAELSWDEIKSVSFD